MKVSEAFPSQYIEAADLDGKDFTLTITKVIDQHEGTGKDGKKFVKPLLHFQEAKKPFALNKTNAKLIRDCLGYGNEMQSWVGKKITIYPTMTKFGKDRVPCVRVRIEE